MIDKLLWAIKYWCIGIFSVILFPFLLIWVVVIELPIRFGKFVNTEVDKQ